MAFQVRIDQARRTADNKAEIIYSSGATPLPVGSEGRGMVFSSREEFVAQLQRFRDEQVEEALLNLLLALWAHRNPTLNNPSLLIGRTITVNFDAANISTGFVVVV